MRTIALSAVVALFTASPALADAPIATANSGAGATAPAPAPPPLSSVANGVADQPMAIGPCGPEKVKPDGSLATTPHGTVEAGVGTNGYRHLAGSVCQPIGQNAAVAISVGETQGGGWSRR